ncbi:MAG: twin-arginine translocation signal domain-containing protein [Bacteroidales bacterium]|nr:twin-arginine translocation signal domain-containing protein [Bacteroidales bacterium]
MNQITRRTFVKNSAAAGGMLFIAPCFGSSVFAQSNPTQMGYFENEFGINDNLCQMLLEKALSKGGDFADVYFEHTIENWLMLEDGKVNRSYGNILLGVGIRTVKGDQVGYGFIQELTKESMLSAAATAASLVNENSRPVASSYKSLKTPNYYPFNDSTIDIPLQSKLPVVKAINEKCFSLSNLIIKVNAGFHDSIKRILIYTSDGVKAEDILPRNFLFASTVAKKDGRTEQSWYNFGGRRDFSYYSVGMAEKLSEIVVARTVNLFDAIQPPAGEMPVVLGPGVTGILLHEAIGHGMEADFNRKKISTYSNMLGKKVAQPFVTIIDDGTNPQQLGSINVDDEGIPGKKTVMVENGILTSYLHDKISAKHYGVEPTGNGRRQSYEHYPQPRMRNTYMLGGKEAPEDVIKAAKNGIYIEDVSNGQVKIGEGDFAFYVSQGRMIEDGKLTAPIKDVNIMGNGPKMLENITMVANDLQLHEGGAGACGKGGQSVPVSFGLPTCLVKSMTVGGTRQKGGAS